MIKILKFLVAFLILNSIFYLLNSSPAVAFAQSALYIQPGQGIFQCHDSSNIGADYLKGGSVIVRWDALQPTDNNTINETALNNLVNAIKQGGKKKYLHFQIYGGGGAVLPPWMKVYDFNCGSSSCVASGWQNQCLKGNVYEPCFNKENDLIPVIFTSKGVFPAPWDILYQGYLDKFLKLLSTKLKERGANSFIEYLEPSVGGNWAGTNLWFSDDDLGNWAASAGCSRTDYTCLGQRFTQGVNKITDLYMVDFPDFGMIIVNDGCAHSQCNYSGHQYLYNTYGSRVMIKAAGLGSNSDGACGRRDFFRPICGYDPANPNKFLTKCGQETGGDSKSDYFFKPPCGYDSVYKDSLKNESISYYCMYDYDISLPANQITNQFVADHLGAQIEILTKSLSVSEAHTGDQISVSIGWKNTGSAVLSAPIKQNLRWTASSYKLFLEFINNSGVSSYYQEFNLNPPTNTWQPVLFNFQTQTSTLLNIPDTLGGSDPNSRTAYKVYAGLTDPNGEKVRFALRNSGSNNDLINKRYLISDSFTVVGRGVVTCQKGDIGNLDCDSSEKIDETDLDILLSNWAPNGPVPQPSSNHHTADLNSDSKVNEADINILLQNWNP